MSLGAPILALDCNELTGITLGGVATLLPNSGGAWTGGTLGAAAQAAKFGTAATFNGTSGYAGINSSLIGSDPTAFTLACWAKGAAQSDKRIIAFGSSTSSNPAIALQTGTVGTAKARLWWRLNSITTAVAIESSADAFDSTWHHIAATWDGTTASVYVDGELSGSSTPTISTTTLNRTAIGALLRATPAAWFAGSLDEIRIYDAAATAGEIAGIMNGAYLSTSGLLARRRRMMQCA
jgi:hypothetical protein